jgi:outer membrane immunogenic protein
VGYNFGIIPLLDLGIEGSYVDFGTQDGKILNTTGNEIEATAWDAFGVVGLSLGPFGLFAKAGMAAWNVDIDTNNFGNASESGEDPVYGIGAKFQIASFAIRAEYELFAFDDVDMDFYSVGVAYTF